MACIVELLYLVFIKLIVYVQIHPRGQQQSWPLEDEEDIVNYPSSLAIQLAP
jgi:hypothetical protein